MVNIYNRKPNNSNSLLFRESSKIKIKQFYFCPCTGWNIFIISEIYNSNYLVFTLPDISLFRFKIQHSYKKTQMKDCKVKPMHQNTYNFPFAWFCHLNCFQNTNVLLSTIQRKWLLLLCNTACFHINNLVTNPFPHSYHTHLFYGVLSFSIHY